MMLNIEMDAEDVESVGLEEYACVCVGQTEELAQIRQSCENWHIASAWSGVLWRFSCNHQNLNVESAFSQKALKGRIDLAVQRCSRRKRGETRDARDVSLSMQNTARTELWFSPTLLGGDIQSICVQVYTKKGSVYGDGSSVQ